MIKRTLRALSIMSILAFAFLPLIAFSPPAAETTGTVAGTVTDSTLVGIAGATGATVTGGLEGRKVISGIPAYMLRAFIHTFFWNEERHTLN